MKHKVVEKFGIKFVYSTTPKNNKLSCDLCDHILTSIDDLRYGDQYGVCDLCHLKIVQPNLKKWVDGWRPAKILEERILPDLAFAEGDN